MRQQLTLSLLLPDIYTAETVKYRPLFFYLTAGNPHYTAVDFFFTAVGMIYSADFSPPTGV